jgi:DNA-binding response OmpR family regulator
MPMKNVLVVADDPTLLQLLQEKLEGCGLRTRIAQDGDAARAEGAHIPPDLVLLDPLLVDDSGLSLIDHFKPVAPVIVFSSGPSRLLRAAESLGAQTLRAHPDPIFQLLSETTAALSIPSPVMETPPDASLWREGAPDPGDSLPGIRRAVFALAKSQRDPATLHELLREVHRCSERARFIGLQAPFRFTSAFEALVADLHAMPESVNASSLQTATQAVDFLVVLFTEGNLKRLVDPATAQVFAVDDEATSREQILAALKLVNVHTACAGDAGTAVTMLQDNPFDAILLDVNLPGTNGFELCRQLREFEDHAHTPVIFITGMATFRNRAQATLSGGNDFIAKPFNLHELGLKTLMWIFRHQLGLV